MKMYLKSKKFITIIYKNSTVKLRNKEHEKFSLLLYCYLKCSTQFKLRGNDWLLTHWTDLLLFSSPEMVTKEGGKDRAAEIDLTRIFWE